MVILLVITASAAWLLGSAGAVKILRPSGTANAIRELFGVTNGRLTTRLLGVTELLASLGFLVFPGVWTGFAIAILYLGFFVAAAILKKSDTDCGCFGSVGGRVTTSHLVVTATLSLAGIGVMLMGIDIGSPLGTYTVLFSAIPAAVLLYAILVPLTDLHDALGVLQS